jgi:hypothetical protein
MSKRNEKRGSHCLSPFFLSNSLLGEALIKMAILKVDKYLKINFLCREPNPIQLIVTSICSHKLESKASWKSIFSKNPWPVLLRMQWITIMNPYKIWCLAMKVDWLTLIIYVRTFWSIVDKSLAIILYNPWINLIGLRLRKLV